MVRVRLWVWLASVLVNVVVGRPVMLWDPVRLKVRVGRPVGEQERVKLAVWVRLGRDPVADSVMARVVLPDGVTMRLCVLEPLGFVAVGKQVDVALSRLEAVAEYSADVVWERVPVSDGPVRVGSGVADVVKEERVADRVATPV